MAEKRRWRSYRGWPAAENLKMCWHRQSGWRTGWRLAWQYVSAIISAKTA
jgi:hypothetical protein